MKRWLEYVPIPAVVLVLALGAFWLMSRWDGAQTARLAELDRQHQEATDQGRKVAQARRQTVAASEAADRKIARLEARQRVTQDSLAAATARAAALEDTVATVLAALPPATAQPVRELLASKDDQIRHLGGLLADERQKSAELLEDRDRWKAQAANEAAMAATWKRRADDWRDEARRGCLPVVGCPSRTVTLLAGAALGAGGTLALQ
ncbi:MAG: hypothetical protein IPK12_23410 [Gemmatimonadetes bacterium]|nr:hypothetical protein [Gemmatimonadota bacterium]